MAVPNTETNRLSITKSENSTTMDNDHFCKLILYLEIPSVNIRIWDVAILVPNLIFMVYLVTKLSRARLKLRAANSPIFLTFYCLVLFNVFMSILRCLISMTLNYSNLAADSINITLWVVVKCFFLATEMSVIVFALAFGHMESRSSIRYVLITTSLISLVYSASQGALEILMPDSVFRITSKDLNLFGHGGVLFWLISSVVFTMLYLLILVLPFTRLREKLPLPVNRSFYVYVLMLAMLNGIGSIGCAFLLIKITEGLCIVDVTTFLYFTLFTPLVYVTFLSTFFNVSQSSIMFSYKAQNDDRIEDDTVSLPHQPSFSSLKTDSDYIYQTDHIYNNTRFSVSDRQIANPLYNASLQSPDSITGYSMDEQTITSDEQKN
ncbi:transmembrane protein adipocyte-associated 1 homolog [Adelges cooleyi]|uniref:transmembrane protein adipocyte-associated 1 homolog n=1 Tax=Adelges cooleyi TaxID=133065 RepID=UPI00218098D1|nr:transmembrane protein adipocyte-associated 1 homolog [Adelges cooleyi]XP_050423783.1 transmembrane protein adipocyte-associated 1 homolog [Adelges cooleyi]